MRVIKLVLVWLWVAVPLSWGVMKSVRKARPLFEAASAAREEKRRETQAAPAKQGRPATEPSRLR